MTRIMSSSTNWPSRQTRVPLLGRTVQLVLGPGAGGRMGIYLGDAGKRPCVGALGVPSLLPGLDHFSLPISKLANPELPAFQGQER